MKILVADKFELSGIEQLKMLGYEVVYRPGTTGPALATALCQEGFEALVVRSTKVPRETIEASQGLKLIVRAGAGTDTIDVGSATKRGIRVCNCPGMNSTAVAELTIGMMIALDRRIVDETDDLRHRVWNKKEYSKARGLKGRTLGILGLGRIGYEVAKRAKAFDMRVLYADVIARPEAEDELGVFRVSMNELFAESDFLTLHVPGGEETTHVVNEETLARMKPSAFIINCSRGGVVDEQALGVAINEGRIAGAALDVYEIEPSADDREFKDPILDVRRVYGTHHIGASTEQAQTAVAEETVRIVKGFVERGEFLNCMNEPTGEMVDAA
ncbi:MAG TPA: hydroxyacid dehydrogenase [Phycisphaerae bacterium]|nr:hydroxyacid dehydrogenase [Phycisphaerae bacterium]